jgi:hypothetical protein
MPGCPKAPWYSFMCNLTLPGWSFSINTVSFSHAPSSAKSAKSKLILPGAVLSHQNRFIQSHTIDLGDSTSLFSERRSGLTFVPVCGRQTTITMSTSQSDFLLGLIVGVALGVGLVLRSTPRAARNVLHPRGNERWDAAAYAEVFASIYSLSSASPASRNTANGVGLRPAGVQPRWRQTQSGWERFYPVGGILAQVQGVSVHDRPVNTAERPPADFTCAICLDTPSCMTEMASISGCMHQFCFDCIHRWAERKNKCPSCNARFESIYRMVALTPSTIEATTGGGGGE